MRAPFATLGNRRCIPRADSACHEAGSVASLPHSDEGRDCTVESVAMADRLVEQVAALRGMLRMGCESPPFTVDRTERALPALVGRLAGTVAGGPRGAWPKGGQTREQNRGTAIFLEHLSQGFGKVCG